MDSIPDAIVEQILSQMSNARDIAVSMCVSKRWKESVPYLRSLYFPRNSFNGIASPEADASIGRMVLAALYLEELIIYCPFSSSSLGSWLSHKSRSLKRLELRMDSILDRKSNGVVSSSKLDPIGCVEGLESLRLWGVCLTNAPKWRVFDKLRVLEIVGMGVKDNSLTEMLRACPNLTELSLLGCEGASTVRVELEHLQICKLDFVDGEYCSLTVCCPKIQVLEVQGFSSIRVIKKHCLRSLSICKVTGKVYHVEMGKLKDLEELSLRGVQWTWNALSSVLQCATEVKHLFMKVEFCGDYDRLLPFPQVDLIEFFNNHQKLQRFEIHGALFAAFCLKDGLRKIGSKFSIPCLEETVITVRSPLNAEQKLNTIELLAKYSKNLKKMVIRVSQMRNCQGIADDFFEEICKFACQNKAIRIE